MAETPWHDWFSCLQVVVLVHEQTGFCGPTRYGPERDRNAHRNSKTLAAPVLLRCYACYGRYIYKKREGGLRVRVFACVFSHVCASIPKKHRNA